ncbi:MAG TPA: hypothetical protein VJ385_13795 [Fibrobacteria bacterium]|nr:hypothetical protein [Fibrobacteria bacterium]
MKPGSALGAVWALTVIVLAPLQAQNLGLGTGSRAAREDSAAQEPRFDRPDEASAPRKSQLNKRLGLTARRNAAFDPKVFEARGRELQGQFYEIGTPANPKQYSGEQTAAGASVAQRKNGSRQWLTWVGIAGVAGASAGAIGYLLMSNAHPATAPSEIPLNLDDGP